MMFKPTEKKHFFNRRQLLHRASQLGLIAGIPLSACAKDSPEDGLKVTAKDLTTTYNNFYEFSTHKQKVAELAKDFTLTPWQIQCSGLIEHPQTIDLAKLPTSSEYIYRFRCVEGWSMVVPWHGFELRKLIEQLKPLSSAKYVRFTTVLRPKEMPGQRRRTLDWPYTEGLRLDEAMHPLTLLATGIYGDSLPAQNGGPLRLVVPWKYGFKSIKSIDKIEFLAEQPDTTWALAGPDEYGFYANVNPAVPHPRWSQRRELPLGQYKKVPTLPFNGYQEHVASLYDGMDLRRYF